MVIGYLSEIGKEEMGRIFPLGKVPLKSIVKETATLGGLKGVRDVYRIDIDRLSYDEFAGCINYMAAKHKSSSKDVEKNIRELGFIPMRAEQISSVSTTMAWFI